MNDRPCPDCGNPINDRATRCRPCNSRHAGRTYGGRKRVYANGAARCKAYRNRKALKWTNQPAASAATN